MKLIAIILLLSITPSLVYSKSKSVQITGFIQSVEVIKKNITRDIPKKKKYVKSRECQLIRKHKALELII